jgi:hypothetical protein
MNEHSNEWRSKLLCNHLVEEQSTLDHRATLPTLLNAPPTVTILLTTQTGFATLILL